jgi:hypothetical protein
MAKGQRSRSSLVGGFALAAVLVVALGACGGGSSSPKAAAGTTTTTAAGGRGNFAAAFAAYSTCMGQHGVKLPTRTPGSGGPRPTGGGAGGEGGGGGGFPGGGGGFGGGFGRTPQSLPAGVTQAQYTAAQKACASKLPTCGFGGGRGGAAGTAAFQAYTGCMKDHGVTVGSFRPGGATPTTAAGSTPTTSPRNNPKFIAANKVCGALLPTFGGGTTTTTAG